ncbi:MAG: ribonuclease H family protein [Saprospiraceae bacterium]
MAKAAKSYVVWIGRKPGVYASWEACQAQIFGFQGAAFKSFPSRAEAEVAFRQGPPARNYTPIEKSAPKASIGKGYIEDSLAVDAACSGNPGRMEFRGVHVGSGKELFKFGPYEEGTNNVGEFLGILTGLKYLKESGLDSMPIYTDSRTAMVWVKNKKHNSKLVKSARNAKLFEMMERGMQWYLANQTKNPILKWETKVWGEIPADFGRK